MRSKGPRHRRTIVHPQLPTTWGLSAETDPSLGHYTRKEGLIHHQLSVTWGLSAETDPSLGHYTRKEGLSTPLRKR
ncbi:hypothetical protein INT45_008749 [Circinella minor]|uniref:Uncharacterized protein n=1 Tax=Circinella minor TaxID=1195481 RepID=A0A8H7VL67_9FUNG|nr:hypothetical protein INT45_008749 [Circinella minor]